jgi:hypothetical protein
LSKWHAGPVQGLQWREGIKVIALRSLHNLHPSVQRQVN